MDGVGLRHKFAICATSTGDVGAAELGRLGAKSPTTRRRLGTDSSKVAEDCHRSRRIERDGRLLEKRDDLAGAEAAYRRAADLGDLDDAERADRLRPGSRIAGVVNIALSRGAGEEN